MDEEFNAAAAWVSQQNGVSNPTKLELYALFKIATTSSPAPPGSRPGFWDMTGRAKYDAWQSKGEALSAEASTSSRLAEVADALYIDLVKSLGWQGPDSESSLKQDAPKEKGMVSVSTMALANEEEEEGHQPGTSGQRTLHDLATDGQLDELRARCPLQDVNKSDSFGFTPLHLAADRGHAAIVSLLLEQGADPSLKDGDGFTPLELAEVAERTQVMEALKAHR